MPGPADPPHDGIDAWREREGKSTGRTRCRWTSSNLSCALVLTGPDEDASPVAAPEVASSVTSTCESSSSRAFFELELFFFFFFLETTTTWSIELGPGGREGARGGGWNSRRIGGTSF